EPQWFTTERMKNKRGNKLYLDYVQHHEGKTIVAPYSPRGNADGLIATPLLWQEVNEKLKPSQFPMEAVLERVRMIGDPFRTMRQAAEEQAFGNVLTTLKKLL